MTKQTGPGAGARDCGRPSTADRTRCKACLARKAATSAAYRRSGRKTKTGREDYVKAPPADASPPDRRAAAIRDYNRSLHRYAQRGRPADMHEELLEARAAVVATQPNRHSRKETDQEIP